MSIHTGIDRSSNASIDGEPRRHGLHRVGEPIEFVGYADDFVHAIAKVQLSLDGGTSWTDYPTSGALPDVGVSWRFAYTPQQPGVYLLHARTVNGAGEVSRVTTSFAFEVLASDANGSDVEGDADAVAEEGDPDGRAFSQLQAEALPTNLVEGIETFGSFHARPIGGSSLAGAKLFRSGDLFGATAGELMGIVGGLGIKAVYDVRNEFETASRPQPYPVGVKTVALRPATERRSKNASERLVAGVIGRYGAPEERMVRNYRRFALEYPLIGAALRGIADEGVPALVHCVNGKDRTGVMCATMMVAAGFSFDEAMADYLATNAVHAADIAREAAALSAGMTDDERAVLMSFLEARPAYLEAFFDAATSEYGTFERYLAQGMRLTPRHRANLARLFDR